MAKSTIEAMEKVFLKLVQPLETKITKIFAMLEEIQSELKRQEKNTIKDGSSQNSQPLEETCNKPKVTQNKLSFASSAASSSSPTTETTTARGLRASARHQSAPKKIVTTRASPLPNLVKDQQVSAHHKPPPAPRATNPKTNDNTSRDVATKPADTLPPPAVSLNSPTSPTSKGGNKKWETIERKRRQGNNKRSAIIIGAGTEDNELKAIERLKHLQAWSFKPETTSDIVLRFMNKVHQSSDYTVEKRTIKTDRHAAFIIGIPESIFDHFNTPTAWPQGVRITDWFLRRPRAERGSRRSTTTASGSATTADAARQRTEKLQ